MTQKSVAIITSTIGRAELERNILSVKNQTYPCKHYIFVDGEKFAEKAKSIVEKYDDLIVTYLPMNTGANGWVNSSINTIAPYLVKEDIICYVDDDNWVDANHIQTIIDTFEKDSSLDFVYTLRKFFDAESNYICNDDSESLGYYENKLCDPFSFNIEISGKKIPITQKLNTHYHIDTNCYAFTKETAIKLAPVWFSGIHNDKNIFKRIIELNLKGGLTRQYSVNYTLIPRKYFNLYALLTNMGFQLREDIFHQLEVEIIKYMQQENIRRHNGKHWAE